MKKSLQGIIDSNGELSVRRVNLHKELPKKELDPSDAIKAVCPFKSTTTPCGHSCPLFREIPGSPQGPPRLLLLCGRGGRGEVDSEILLVDIVQDDR